MDTVESILNDLVTLQVGDLVDVDCDEVAFSRVRVLRIVEDVNAEAGPPDPRNPKKFAGPGFVGKTDEGELVFSLNDVIPWSKARYFLPQFEENNECPCAECEGC